jgi:voltage-gated potassium channel
MGIMAYTVGMVAQWMVDFQIRSIIGRRKLGRAIKSMKDHYIICGYGRIGKVVAQELESYRIPFVVIDSNTESKQAFEAQGFTYIIDDATSEDVLLEAGVERAKGLVSAVHTNADNMFITMSGRVLNPNLFILARADDEQTQKKLLRAGANRVELPYLIGGRKMAQSIVKPAVTDFVDLTLHDNGIELRMEELRVGGGSRLNGVTLIDSGIRQEMDIIIVAIRKKDGEMIFNPSSQSRMEADDTLIALGHGQDLKRLASILAGR